MISSEAAVVQTDFHQHNAALAKEMRLAKKASICVESGKDLRDMAEP